MVLIIYTKNGCKNCEILKNVLNKVGNYEISIENVGSLEHVRKTYEDFDEQFDSINEFPVSINTGGNENDAPIILNFSDSMKMYGEVILDPRNNKYTLFPIVYDSIYEQAKKARAVFWQPEEIDFSKDYSDLTKLNNQETHFIFHILAFFAASDALVLENLECNFSQEIQIQEILHALAIQKGIEAIHSETYSILLDTYVKDQMQKTQLFSALEKIKTIKDKALWVKKFTNQNTQPFAKRLLAFICVEGIMFSGSFCAIYWLKDRSLLPGLTFSNELISRDEGLHTNMGISIYNMLKHKLKYNDVKEVITSAVNHEKEFITEAIPCSLIGMNSKLMCQYIEYVADRTIIQLGYPKIYNSECPFEFMEKISLSGKTNFFEKRVGEYSKAGVMVSQQEQCFKLDEEF